MHWLAISHEVIVFAPAQVFVTGLQVPLRHALAADPTGPACEQLPWPAGNAEPLASAGAHCSSLMRQNLPAPQSLSAAQPPLGMHTFVLPHTPERHWGAA
jgi:hypothetical protein